jgi:hypothetical protein
VDYQNFYLYHEGSFVVGLPVVVVVKIAERKMKHIKSLLSELVILVFNVTARTKKILLYKANHRLFMTDRSRLSLSVMIFVLLLQ